MLLFFAFLASSILFCVAGVVVLNRMIDLQSEQELWLVTSFVCVCVFKDVDRKPKESNKMFFYRVLNESLFLWDAVQLCPHARYHGEYCVFLINCEQRVIKEALLNGVAAYNNERDHERSRKASLSC